MQPDPMTGTLTRYFERLDARDLTGLLSMFADDGVMITRGGTEGKAVVGRAQLAAFYESRGPATARHEISSSSESAGTSMAEGLVRPLVGEGAVKFFIASALLDESGQIKRYTTLVWPDVSLEQAAILTTSTRIGVQ